MQAGKSSSSVNVIKWHGKIQNLKLDGYRLWEVRIWWTGVYKYCEKKDKMSAMFGMDFYVYYARLNLSFSGVETEHANLTGEYFPSLGCVANTKT